MSMNVSHQSVNPHAKKMLNGGPMTNMMPQKNKGMARRRRTMKNRFQGTRPAGPIKIPRKMAGGYYPHSDWMPY